MALRLRDKWIWDFWLVRRGEEHHIFYLQAPRTLEQPSLRHHHASIGHAVSHDLRTWRVLPDALAPGPEGSWDDLATWTGSTIGHNGRWYMLYTGINRSEQGLIQRIGLAVSDDLISWEKHPANPVLEADPRWYELLDLDRWYDLSWRDPWLFQHPDSEFFHALITARSPQGAPDGAGIVGHARSRDLVDWEVLPPLTLPGEFAQVEAPQLVSVDGRYAILVLRACGRPLERTGREARHPRRDGNLRPLGGCDVRTVRARHRADRSAPWPARHALCREARRVRRHMGVHGLPRLRRPRTSPAS